MPEAVVVSVARSPIGRAVKGSLATMRPDDLASQVIQAVLDKVPELDPREIDDLMLGCAQPSGEAGYNIARAVAVELGYDFLPGTTVNRFCSSSLQAARMAFHAIKAGEGDVFISAGVETVSRLQQGRRQRPAWHTQQRLRCGPGPYRQCRPRALPSGTIPARTANFPTSTSRWARPPKTWPYIPVSAARTKTAGRCAARTALWTPLRAACSIVRSSR